MFLKRVVSLSNLTLLVALTLSTVAAYYSIVGLTAIFAGAVIPIIIMGSVLEVGKITTTVWLRKYWGRCSWILKAYLVPAVVLLALLTSMGIFGFLSKAHMDQGLVSGDVQAKLSLYDEKIKTQRDNIELARKALTQMDAQVDQRLSRSDSENAAERAVAIRRQQQGERAKLQKEIGDAQQEIQKLNEERAPIAAENRKVEAEVGPVKYIAALIYGDNPDQNVLEKAVRWVIILLVIVFDPLAIALVLAANASKEWDDEEPKYEQDDGPLTEDQIMQVKESVEITKEETNDDPHTIGWMFPKNESEVDRFAYLKRPFVHFVNTKPLVYKEEEPKIEEVKEIAPEPEPIENVYNDERLVTNMDKKILAAGIDAERPGDYVMPLQTEIITEGVTKPAPLEDLGDGYVLFNGAHYSKQALKEMKPELFIVKPDDGQVKTNFGTQFPAVANKGDIFVRVDALPNRVFKFSGNRWIEINKDNTNSYLYDQEYVKYLVNKISSGEYDVELLSDNERAQIEEYLKTQNS